MSDIREFRDEDLIKDLSVFLGKSLTGALVDRLLLAKLLMRVKVFLDSHEPLLEHLIKRSEPSFMQSDAVLSSVEKKADIERRINILRSDIETVRELVKQVTEKNR